MTVRLITDAFRLSLDGIRLGKTIHDSVQNPDTFSTVDAVLEGVTFGASATAFGASCGGASHKTLATIKTAETVAHAVHAPVRMTKSVFDYANNKTSPVDLICNGLVSPYASMTRTVSEQTIHKFKHLKTASDEERANYQVNTPSRIGNTPGKKGITLEECDLEISAAKKVKAVSGGIEIAAKSAGLVAKACTSKDNIIANLQTTVGQLNNRVQNLNGQAQALNGQIQAHPLAKRNAVIQHDPYTSNLTHCNYIPNALHNDILFRRFICHLSGRPIRYPIADPVDGTLYETRHINRRLAANPVSPTTGQPLHANQLAARPALQASIDERLQYHTQLLQNPTPASLNTQPQANLLQATNAENQNYP